MSLSSLEPRYWMHWDSTVQPCLDETPHTTAHRIRECSLFNDTSLAALLSRHPRQDIRLTTMGHNPSHPNEIQYGELGSITGVELLQLVRRGRLCVQLRNLCARRDALAALTRNLGRELDECLHSRAVDTEASLEISSPQSLQFLNIETSHQVVWQIRGARTVKLFPATEPILSANTLDSIASRTHSHPLYYEPAFDALAQQLELTAGWLVTVPALKPSLAVNSNELNVILTTHHQTVRSQHLVQVHRANHRLRRFIPVNSPDRTNALCGWLKRRIGKSVTADVGTRPPTTFRLPATADVVCSPDQPIETIHPAFAPIETELSPAYFPAETSR